MAISSFTATQDWADDAAWTDALMDAFVDALEVWITADVVAKAPDKTGTETISGDWTLTGDTAFSGNLLLGATASTAGNYTMAASDHVILKTGITGGGDTISLISAATVGAGRVLMIKDAAGTAGTNNITVDPSGSETIDGSTTYVMNTNYESIILVSGGTNWHLMATANA